MPRFLLSQGGRNPGAPLVNVCNPVVESQKWDMKVIKRAAMASGLEERPLVQIRNKVLNKCIEIVSTGAAPATLQPVLADCKDEATLRSNANVGDVVGAGGGAEQMFAVLKFQKVTHGFKLY